MELLEKLTSFELVKKFPAFYGIHMCLSPVPILSQLDPVHTLTSHFLKSLLNITFPSTPRSLKWFLSSGFPTKTVYMPLRHTRYMPNQSQHLPWLEQNTCLRNICGSVMGNEYHRCTVHFVKSLQLLTNKCTYITFTSNTLKHLKPLRHVSIFSDHHQGGSSFLAKVMKL